MISKAKRGLCGLTAQQLLCVKLVVENWKYEAIAALMGLSVKTVDYHLNNARTILGVAGTPDLVRWAILAGVTSL